MFGSDGVDKRERGIEWNEDWQQYVHIYVFRQGVRSGVVVGKKKERKKKQVSRPSLCFSDGPITLHDSDKQDRKRSPLSACRVCVS